MTVFALTEVVPTAPKPSGSTCLFPPSNQSAANGDLSSVTSVALPGTVGGGSGVGTFRWIGPDVANGTTTDQGEPNSSTVTGFGCVATSANPSVLMPMSAIAAGTWTFLVTIASLTYTGTFAIGFRAWQISNDRATKTLITLPGADASGWVFTGTITPSSTAAVTTTLTMTSTGAVTFGGTTPYLYIEMILKIVSIGATTATLKFSNASNSLQIPKITYSNTGADTLTTTDSCQQGATRSRTGTDSAITSLLPTYVGALGTFQSNSPSTTTNATQVITLTNPVASGSQIVVVLNTSGVPGTTPRVPYTCTDSAGNTYTTLEVYNATFSTYQRIFVATASRAMTTSDTITLTLNTSYNMNTLNITAFNVTGVDPTSLAQVATAVNSGSAPTITSSSTLNLGDVIIGVVSLVNGLTGDTFTQDSDTVNGSWQSPTRVGSASSGANGASLLDTGVKILTAGGAQTYNPTITIRTSTSSMLRLTAVSTSSVFSDSAACVATRSRTGAETTAVTDTAAEVATRSRTGSETTTLSETASPTSSRSRTAVETTALSEVATRTQVLSRAQGETTVLSEAAIRTETLGRAQSEATSLSEAATRSQALGRTPTETTTLTDTAGTQATRVRTATETTVLTDSVLRLEQVTRSGSETTSLSESASRSQVLQRLQSETTSLADSVVTHAVRSRMGAETTNLSDTGIRVALSTRSGSETTALSEVAVRAQALFRNLSETTTLSDAATRVSQSIRKATDYLAGTPDFPVSFPTKSINGVVYDEDTHAAISGATVTLHREADGLDVQTTTSAAGGSYSFSRDTFDPYTYLVVVDWFDGTVWRHGTSDPGQVPA